MSLLKMIRDSEHKPEITLHVGMGFIYMPEEHLEKLIDHYNLTGVNLIDSYRDTIAFNNSDYVDYLKNHRGNEDFERSKIASRISRIRSLNIFDPEYVIQSLYNVQKFEYHVVKNKLSKRERRRAKASKYIQKKNVREWVFTAHGEECLCCGSKDDISIDHIVPVSLGGKDELSNLQPLCKSCNSSKGTTKKDYR